jgi:hypothetical protein
MIRISEIHADGLVAKTHLATLGNPDLDLLPHEVVGWTFLVDYRRHSHDAFSCYSALMRRGSKLSRANSSAHAELFSIDMVPADISRLRERLGSTCGPPCSRLADEVIE